LAETFDVDNDVEWSLTRQFAEERRSRLLWGIHFDTVVLESDYSENSKGRLLNLEDELTFTQYSKLSGVSKTVSSTFRLCGGITLATGQAAEINQIGR
jgi:hypothetical protein